MIKVKTYFLGGIESQGTNCLVIEWNKNFAIFNFGQGHVPKDVLGSSRQVGDYRHIKFLIDKGYKFLGVFLNSYRNKHIGGLKQLFTHIKEFNVYGSSHSIDMLKSYLEANKVFIKNKNLIKLDFRSSYGIRDIGDGVLELDRNSKASILNERPEFEAIELTHFNTLSGAIGSSGYFFRIMDKSFCIMGDFFFGTKLTPNSYLDIESLSREIIRMPCLLLNVDLGNIDHASFTTPNDSIESLITKRVKDSLGAIMIALDLEEGGYFYTVLKVCSRYKKTICIASKSMFKHYKILESNGDLKDLKLNVISPNNLDDTALENLIVIYGDSFDNLEEEFYNLLDEENDKENLLKRKFSDAIIAIINNPIIEARYQKIVSEISKHIPNIATIENKILSKRASMMDLAMLQNILTPAYLVAENAQYRVSWRAEKYLNEKTETKYINIDNMEVLTFERQELRKEREFLKNAQIQILSSKGSHNLHSNILRDRRVLGDDGIFIATICLNSNSMPSATSIDIEARGVFSSTKASDKIKSDMKNEILEFFNTKDYRITVHNEYTKELESLLRKKISKSAKKKPTTKVAILRAQ